MELLRSKVFSSSDDLIKEIEEAIPPIPKTEEPDNGGENQDTPDKYLWQRFKSMGDLKNFKPKNWLDWAIYLVGGTCLSWLLWPFGGSASGNNESQSFFFSTPEPTWKEKIQSKMTKKNGAIAAGIVAAGAATKYFCSKRTKSSSDDDSEDNVEPEVFVYDLKGGIRRISKRGIRLKHMKKDKTVLIVGLIIIALLGCLVLFIYCYFCASAPKKGKSLGQSSYWTKKTAWRRATPAQARPPWPRPCLMH